MANIESNTMATARYFKFLILINKTSFFKFSEIESQTPSVPISNRRLWKNLLVLGVAWTLLYTAFQGKFKLLSSF
jgi:hypothetical protein